MPRVQNHKRELNAAQAKFNTGERAEARKIALPLLGGPEDDAARILLGKIAVLNKDVDQGLGVGALRRQMNSELNLRKQIRNLPNIDHSEIFESYSLI